MFDELRKKPKAVRNQYAFWGAVAITAVIGAVWLVALSVRFDGDDALQVDTKESSGAFSQFYDEATKNLTEVFSSIKNSPKETEATSTPEEEVVSATTSTTVEDKKPPQKAVQIVTSSSSASSTAPVAEPPAPAGG